MKERVRIRLHVDIEAAIQREAARQGIKLGTLTLSNLSRGKFRELSDSELAALKKAAKL